MKLTLLGTGTFFITSERSSSSYLLEIDDRKILIDCGPGTLMRLSQLGIKPCDLDYIFITHFHADHTSDLFPLFMNCRLSEFFPSANSDKYPIIYGPSGIEDFLSKSAKNYELPCFDNWDKIKIKSYSENNIFSDFKFLPFKVEHTSFGFMANAYSLRFETDNKIIVFSGDCINCQGIKNASENADIFVCDCSSPAGMKNRAHMDTNDIAEIAQDGSVKKIILSHFYPEYDGVDLVGEVKKSFSGEVIKGKDLMEFLI
ncbi:MBL fold metallo-hydrolase [Candidatus Microgenomates bacterium]|nr:MBL fold metallo-hydrolase [Candidatus Microgenomates bacterium]